MKKWRMYIDLYARYVKLEKMFCTLINLKIVIKSLEF